MDTPENTLEENRHLRRAMRDLIALSTLPAIWTGLRPDAIARSLAEMLLHSLALDLIYVRVEGLNKQSAVEVICNKRSLDDASLQALKASLAPLVAGSLSDPPSTVPNPFGAGTLHISVTRFSIADNVGVLIAGSRAADFPSERDRLLLSVGANQAVTVIQRRRLEEQSFEQDVAVRRLAAIVDSSEDAIISKTLNGIIQSWNAAAERIFGYTAEEAVGRPITMLFPADRLDEEDKIISRIRAGERIEHFDTVRVRKDGTAIPLSLTISPIRDQEGQAIGASKIARDITKRKRDEERLRLLSEAAAAVLHAPDPESLMRMLFAMIGPVIGADAYFNYIVSETGDGLSLASCAGIPEEAARKASRLDFGEGICGTAALHRQPIAAAFIQQSDDPKVQLVKSFGIRAFACNPLVSGNLLLGTLSFASRSKDEFAPDELELLGTIAHYVTGAYERLRLMEKLHQADRKKDEFLATLAHELRNPLAPIRTCLQLMQMGGKEAGEQARNMMERQVAQLVRLVDDLMDLTRISQGKIELTKQPVELAAVVNSAVETARPHIEEMGHELTVLLPEQPIAVNADLTRLAQVFLNLLTNAAKYTDRGGRIELTARRQGSDVVVEVKDTGIGIPAEKLRSIFEMFSQVEGTLSRSQGGLGIGLCLVNQLVQMHGGSIEAQSEGPGRGSRFVVRLPIAVEQQGDVITTGDNGEAATASALRILVVDDNRDAAESLAMLLKFMGNNVRTASDGEEGVRVASEFRPHVVLLDIGLPKLNGYEACRRMRRQAWSKSMVILAVTGWGAEEDRRKSDEVGFNCHLVKPVDPTSMMKLLADLNGVEV